MDRKISFKQWCEENDRLDLLDRWDYDKNNKSPGEVLIGSGLKYWFKCPRGIHESETKKINNLLASPTNKLECTKCRSFAQYIIDNFSEEYLNKIWNENNE